MKLSKRAGTQKKVNNSRASRLTEMASQSTRSRRARANPWEPSETQYSWYVLWTAHQWTVRNIAAHANRSYALVYKTVRKIKEWEFDQLIEQRISIAQRQTRALEKVFQRAMTSFESSLQNAVTVKTEEIELMAVGGEDGLATMPAIKTTRTETRQAGDASFLMAGMKALSDIREIWGVNAPKESKAMTGDIAPGSSLIPITATNRKDAVRAQILASLAMLDKQQP